MSKDNAHLESLLRRLDGRGYKAYKEIQGVYEFPGFTLFIDHAQGDPFAAPSRVRVHIARQTAGFGPETTATPSRRIAFCDFLTRIFHLQCRAVARGKRGTGKSGLITIDKPSQEILARTAMAVAPRFVEARFFMGLPAAGRRIAGRHAVAMFIRELPEIVRRSLNAQHLDKKALARREFP